MLDSLFRGRHECYGAFEIAQTAAPNGKAAIVIVVTESRFPTPHRECATCIRPAVENGSYVQICVRGKAGGILPVVGIKELPYSMGRFFPNKARKPRIKYCVFDDVITGAMVLVPTPFPVGHDCQWLVLSNQITDSKLCLFMDWNFSIRILKKKGFCTDQGRRFMRCLPLQ